MLLMLLLSQAHECDKDSASQREKLENELKKELKKLQRVREQIKAW
jgi:CCR4-NOT transcription complex subunit 3